MARDKLPVMFQRTWVYIIYFLFRIKFYVEKNPDRKLPGFFVLTKQEV